MKKKVKKEKVEKKKHEPKKAVHIHNAKPAHHENMNIKFHHNKHHAKNHQALSDRVKGHHSDSKIVHGHPKIIINNSTTIVSNNQTPQ